ncbi:non-ribosomal peptide synthetase [Paenibacillus polymyxa]|uniref:non-ribosomal peptide synthetase n=1 Tax=Paenibacillus polymyxa TaxID=1406 RepID=UPI0023F85DDF|nr:amino acid adenylation domain-containing protein [Paenibacillus polymyxa]
MHYEGYETSSAQKRLYLIDDLLGPNIIYNMPSIRMIKGQLKPEQLYRAWCRLTERHEGLRTSFLQKDGEVLQLVHESIDVSIPYREHSDQSTDKLVSEFIRPFSLHEVPLWRAELVPLADEEFLFLFDIHHIIADAVTINIIFEELMALYHGQELAPLEFQYVDYTIWQNDQLSDIHIQKQGEFWLNQFTEDVPLLSLPTDGKGLRSDYSGGVVPFSIKADTAHSLRALCLQHNVTLYMVLLAAYSILLSKYAGQEDLVIGTPVAGRTHSEFEGIVGMFVNTLALRQKPLGSKQFSAFLEEVADRTFAAFDHQDYPFDMLVEQVNPERISGRNPLFDACFVLENVPQPVVPATEVTFSPYSFEHKISKFDITLYAYEMQEGIGLELEYRKALFKEESASRMLRHFARIVEIIGEQPDIRIEDIDMVTEEERTVLLHTFNQTSSKNAYEKKLHGVPIHRLFEQQVIRTPDHPAVNWKEKQLTYEELNVRANQLARILRQKGVQAEDVVGILATPALEMIVGILAILKAGAAYLPIDPLYPDERIQYLLQDSQAKICLLPTASTRRFPQAETLLLTDPSLYTGESCNLEDNNQARNVMYIIYTSGSTGQPKGVMIEHQSFARLVLEPGPLKITPEDRILQTCSLAFDVSVYELWGTLLSGATLYLIEKEELLSADILGMRMAQYQITMAWFTAPLLNQLIDDKPSIFTGLRLIMTGGDALSPQHMKLLRAAQPDLTIVNAYGPSENTIFTSFHTIQEDYDHNVPIGKPVANTQVYILNASNQLQPIGVPGELCIGGEGLARGYLAREELTASKFVTHPWLPEERMYRSGDCARWLADGTLEFLGRMDHQVKIRGFRIETGEIEARLAHIEGIQEAVVLVRQHNDGIKYLCAYFVSDVEMSQAEVRLELATYLPDYMIPACLIRLPRLPLNVNGKVDRNALPEPDLEALRENEYVPPCNELEQELVRIWSMVLPSNLPMERIGVMDNFFTLGGSSLKATKLVSLVLRELGIDLPLTKLFTYPTIRQLADALNGRAKSEFPARADTLVLLKPGTSQDKHLFFIHDGSLDVSCYMELVNELTATWNYWGIKMDASILAGNKTAGMKEAAHRYVDQIKSIQEKGPYYVAGWSMGGTIAFEMTRQLEEQEERVELLAILDTPPPLKYGKEDHWDRHIQELERMEETLDLSLWKRAFPASVLPLLPEFHELGRNELLERFKSVNHWVKMQHVYQPDRVVTAPVCLFISEHTWELGYKGWEMYCRGEMYTHKVPGDHFSIVKGAQAVSVGLVLNTFLR